MKPCLYLFLFFTFVNGLIYPFFITGFTQLIFPDQANGNFVYKDGKAIGSIYIGQKFSQDKYFWGRPSASDYNTLPSGGSNLSPSNKKLIQTVKERVDLLHKAHGKEAPPADLVYASASGIDPDITVDAALYQLDRIAKARNLSEKQIYDLKSYIELEDRLYWRITSTPYLNLLKLNLNLDELQK